jgi:DNA-binding MarR family transcriptional regulator
MEPLPLRLAHGLAKISLALKSQGRARSLRAGLSPTQAQILVELGRSEPARLEDLARALAVRPPTASEAIDALVRKGLVRRLRERGDRRALALSLSARGRRLAARLAHWPDFLAEAVGALSEAEQVVFHRALIKMIRSLQQRGLIPVARMCVDCDYFRPNVHRNPAAPHHCDFVDAPFGDAGLRIGCPDFRAAPDEAAWRNWVSLAALTGGVTPIQLREE